MIGELLFGMFQFDPNQNVVVGSKCLMQVANLKPGHSVLVAQGQKGFLRCNNSTRDDSRAAHQIHIIDKYWLFV